MFKQHHKTRTWPSTSVKDSLRTATDGASEWTEIDAHCKHCWANRPQMDCWNLFPLSIHFTCMSWNYIDVLSKRRILPAILHCFLSSLRLLCHRFDEITNETTKQICWISSDQNSRKIHSFKPSGHPDIAPRLYEGARVPKNNIPTLGETVSVLGLPGVNILKPRTPQVQ